MEQKGSERSAMRVFQQYLDHRDRNDKLVEEAEIAIIDLAFRLVEKGRSSAADEIESRLRSRNKVVRYYAAIQLSYLDSKRIARKAIPVLQDILESESSDELRDRAEIAMLRIDPDAFDRPEKERPRPQSRMLHLEIRKLGEKEAGFELAIPWALADLALNAIPEEAKRDIRKEGYNIDKIIKDLTRYAGKVFEIKSEDSIIRIWIK